MIGRLQRRFVLYTMFALIITTSILYCIIMITNYRLIDVQANKLADLILNNNGEIPDFQSQDAKSWLINRETKFSTRYLYVKLDAKNNIIEENMTNIASISKENVNQVLQSIQNQNKKTGYYEEYKYKIVEHGDKTKSIVIIDFKVQLLNLVESARQGVTIILAGLVIIAVLLSIFSRKVLSPIIENVDKQKQFISNAGHELKTPIAVIMANAEVMEMTETSPENLELIKSIEKQSERLNELTMTLLSLAKAEEGKTGIEFSEFCVTEMIEDEMNEFKALLKGKEISFDKKQDIKIRGDQNSIKELIIILLDNAIKYTNENGIIKIIAEKQGKNCKLQFMNTCDNPKSIDTSKIFDRFYREDKSRNKKKAGYGIGLSMAKSIVDMHRGKITANVTKDGFFCFTVIL